MLSCLGYVAHVCVCVCVCVCARAHLVCYNLNRTSSVVNELKLIDINLKDKLNPTMQISSSKDIIILKVFRQLLQDT